MMGVISEALIRRSPDRISDTAPGRTPIAVARPPLVLPGFYSPRSIILMSSISHLFRIKLDFDFGISEISGRGISLPRSLGATRGIGKEGECKRQTGRASIQTR